MFLKWFEYAEKCVHNTIDLIVYVRARPELVHDRIQNRNRNEEKTVPFEYIVRLHNLYEAWLFNNNNSEGVNICTANGIPIFILDANLLSHIICTEYERLQQFLLDSPQVNIQLKQNKNIFSLCLPYSCSLFKRN